MSSNSGFTAPLKTEDKISSTEREFVLTEVATGLLKEVLGTSPKTRFAFSYRSPPCLKRFDAPATEVPKESLAFKEILGLPPNTVA